MAIEEPASRTVPSGTVKDADEGEDGAIGGCRLPHAHITVFHQPALCNLRTATCDGGGIADMH
jgi:hypothetical protein